MIRAAKNRLRQFISETVRRELEVAARNVHAARARRLADEAAEYVETHMGYATAFRTKYELLKTALDAVNPALNGLYCEFGVYQGRSINFIAERVQTQVHGFDSFEGLPEDWRPGVMRGAFKTGKLPPVRSNVKLHVGWFQDTIPAFAREHAGPLAFVHVDADLYSSTKTIFDVLGSRIVPGTIIQFDEFFNFPGWKQGEYLAFKEFCDARRVAVRYIGYTMIHAPAQVALAVVSIGDDTGGGR